MNEDCQNSVPTVALTSTTPLVKATEDGREATRSGPPLELGSDERDNDRSQHKEAYEHVATQDRNDDSEDPATPPRRTLSRHFTTSAILGDCIVVLLPIALTAFVISVWRLDNREYVEGSLDSWRNAITVLATAYPILFAWIVGRLMSAAAHWKLERGAEIGLLETLMGSRTVGSTVWTMLQLGVMNIGVLGLGLLALWAVSPLGAQAFLRMLSTEPKPKSVATNVTYFDNNSPSTIGWGTWYSDWYSTQVDLMGTVYTGLIVSSPAAKKAPEDIWGNVKIPLMESDGRLTVGEEWQAVPQEDVEYTSFLGIPIPDAFPPGNTSFLLESTYMDARCSDPTKAGLPPDVETLDRSVLENPPGANGTWRGPCRNGTNTIARESWEEDGTCTSEWFLALDTFVGRFFDDEAYNSSGSPGRPYLTPAAVVGHEDLETRKTMLLFYAAFFASIDGEWGRMQVSSTCQVLQQYVESRVHCVTEVGGRSCAVVEQRLSHLPHPPGNVSFLSIPENFWQISARLPELREGQNTYGVDLSLSYLLNSTRAEGAWSSTHEITVDISKVSGHDFGKRLSQLLNTYLGATQLIMDAATGTFPPDSLSSSVMTETSWVIEMVTVSLGWMIACLLACLVLLCSGILSVVFAHRLQGPEVLGYVSSSVRDSRFVDIPADARHLSNDGLSKRIRSYRVRLGVVLQGDGHERLLGIGREDAVKRMT